MAMLNRADPKYWKKGGGAWCISPQEGGAYNLTSVRPFVRSYTSVRPSVRPWTAISQKCMGQLV